MVVAWGSSRPVVSRIMRNMRGIDATYMDDIKEWIAEAISKMKTKYTVAIRDVDVQICNNVGRIPSLIESIVAVEYNGAKLTYNPDGRPVRYDELAGTSMENLFLSINPLYTAAGDLSTPDGRSKFPRDILLDIQRLPFDDENWYKVQGRGLQTSVANGYVKLWVSELPKDEEGFPLIPAVEEYEEAIYRYCRMMIMETGYEDKVMSYETASLKWEQASGRAISAVSFPSEEQVRSSIQRRLGYNLLGQFED